MLREVLRAVAGSHVVMCAQPLAGSHVVMRREGLRSHLAAGLSARGFGAELSEIVI